MLPAFRQSHLPLLADRRFLLVAKDVSPELAEELTNTFDCSEDRELIPNELGKHNDALVLALERFSDAPDVDARQACDAKELAHQIGSALRSARNEP